jgi:hypothetical protein
LTWDGGITNTVWPAASNVSMIGPSGRSMPTASTPWRSSSSTSLPRPTLVYRNVARATGSPSVSTTQTA